MKRRLIHRPTRSRRGVILLLTAFLLVFMVGLLALAIDVGYLEVAKTQLQESADAAAMAATAELVDNEALTGAPSLADETASARVVAVQYAALNPVCQVDPVIDPNAPNSTSGDVVIGYLADPSDRTQSMDFSDPNRANAVQVRVRRTAGSNGEVDLFFARIFGEDSQAVSATATAAMLNEIGGFETPDDGSNLGILPITLKIDTWNEMMAGNGPDEWGWNNGEHHVDHSGDGILEMNLYPQNTSSPGNVGTIDIGGLDNSTSVLSRQIRDGVTPADLAMHGGKLEMGDDGTLSLNGDTGISDGIKDDLEAVIGEPRMIPLYTTVVNPGNNAQFTIVKFVGIRIMDVHLTGNPKYLTIQRANVKTKGGKKGDGTQSAYIYSPVWLVR